MTYNLLLKQSFGQIKCEVVGHEIAKSEVDKLFDNNNTISSTCDRCGASVILRPKNENEYYIEEY